MLVKGATGLHHPALSNHLVLKSVKPRDAIWCRGSWSTLFHEVACCLFGTKPLPVPVPADLYSITPGYNRLHRDICKTRQETLNFCDKVQLILEILR